MALSVEEKEIRKIIKKTVENMKSLNTYRPQFQASIESYAQMRRQYDRLWSDFQDEGYHITEEYTNKNGSTNVRKTALYQALETLRKDIINHENILGLTPAGLKRINDEMKITKKAGTFDEVLRNAGI